MDYRIRQVGDEGVHESISMSNWTDKGEIMNMTDHEWYPRVAAYTA